MERSPAKESCCGPVSGACWAGRVVAQRKQQRAAANDASRFLRMESQDGSETTDLLRCKGFLMVIWLRYYSESSLPSISMETSGLSCTDLKMPDESDYTVPNRE